VSTLPIACLAAQRAEDVACAPASELPAKLLEVMAETAARVGPVLIVIDGLEGLLEPAPEPDSPPGGGGGVFGGGGGGAVQVELS
jgi:hypothetical protein